MSHSTEDKQVVSLLEYGLNDVSSFICLVIGYFSSLSISGVALHAVCLVPPEVKAGEMQHRNLLLFFSLHIFFGHWIFPLLQLYCCLLCIRSILAGSRLRPSSSGGTDLGLFEHCYFHRFVCVRPPISSRITISLHGGRRKKLHASNVVKSHFWIPWRENEKQSHLTYYLWKMCPVLFVIKRSDLEQFKQCVTSSRHRCNY